jgi:hypothetical protein
MEFTAGNLRNSLLPEQISSDLLNYLEHFHRQLNLPVIPESKKRKYVPTIDIFEKAIDKNLAQYNVKKDHDDFSLPERALNVLRPPFESFTLLKPPSHFPNQTHVAVHTLEHVQYLRDKGWIPEHVHFISPANNVPEQLANGTNIANSPVISSNQVLFSPRFTTTNESTTSLLLSRSENYSDDVVFRSRSLSSDPGLDTGCNTQSKSVLKRLIASTSVRATLTCNEAVA